MSLTHSLVCSSYNTCKISSYVLFDWVLVYATDRFSRIFSYLDVVKFFNINKSLVSSYNSLSWILLEIFIATILT